MKKSDKIIFAIIAMLILAGTAQAFSDEERRHYPVNGSDGATTTGAFNGTVRDFSTLTPIADALLEAMQNDIAVASTSTDSKGNYSLSLPSGNYKLRASVSGYIMEIKPVVSTGTTVNFNLRSGKVLVFDEFVQQALNTSIWNSLTTGIGYITFGNTTYSNSNFTALVIGSGYGGAGSGSITSKTSVSLTDYDVLIFEGRINAYEDNNYGYGDKQPRGLRVGGDGNNAIEFISATGSSIQARTVSSGVATTTNYNLGESVAQWKYVYRIEASSTIVKFYLNGVLIATHTSNIPTGNLNIYMGTNYGGYGNVPISADYLYLAALGIDTTPPSGVTSLKNISYVPTYINWTWYDPTDLDFSKVIIYLNGVFQTNVSKGVQYYNATGLTANTQYTIGTHTVDTTGNVNQTWVNHTAKTASQPTTTPPTYVNGSLFSNTTWYASKSPYIVTGSVTLFPGFTLTIEPGVTVKFYNNTGLVIRGTLNSSGTEAQRIIFTSANASTKGVWSGINIATNLGGKATIKFANFSYAQTAISVECCWGGGPVEIYDATFSYNIIALGGYAGWDTKVERSIFENNTYAVTSADKIISYSTFKNNSCGLCSTERVDVYPGFRNI